jgi:hypothetical protein
MPPLEIQVDGNVDSRSFTLSEPHHLPRLR